MVATIYPLLGPYGPLMSALRLTRHASLLCACCCVHGMADILKYTLTRVNTLKTTSC